MVLIIHHLNLSQSERIPWLCEELGVPYEVKLYQRTASFAGPPEYKALHPMGGSPVIQDGALTLPESCAIIEYIAHKHAGGRLFLGPTHPAYADFLYWWHWMQGTLQAHLIQAMMTRAAAGPSGDISGNPLAVIAHDRFTKALELLDARLKVTKAWIAGSEFTVADVMAVFPLTSMRYFYPFSLKEYPSIVAYLGRVGQREAYLRAMKKVEPDTELLLGPDPPKKPLMP